jgi:hypothetical protein
MSPKRLVSWSTVAGAGYCACRMFLVAVGLIGFGDTICDAESGRPLGMLVVETRESRREDDDDEVLLECLLECLLEEEEVLLDGTSRMFRLRPVVGSVV